jgi:hypothetical protein
MWFGLSIFWMLPGDLNRKLYFRLLGRKVLLASGRIPLVAVFTNL